MSNKLYVAVFNTTKGYYLLLNKTDGKLAIQGWYDKKDAVNYFENAYNSKHMIGYEASMSACINYIEYNPRILTFDDLYDMVQKLNISTKSSVVALNSVSGHYLGLVLDEKLVKPLYDTGINPKLITI